MIVPHNSHEKFNTIKNVSVEQCIETIVISLFAFLVAFIPATFGNIGIRSTFSSLSIFGDGSILNAHIQSASGINYLFNIENINLFATLMNLSTTTFFLILILNVVLSLFLAISRFEKCRIIFRIYSILAGFAMIIIYLTSFIQIVGIAGFIIQSAESVESILLALDASAILTAICLLIFSGILIKKQFKWFESIY
jgi:hypothetical protein